MVRYRTLRQPACRTYPLADFAEGTLWPRAELTCGHPHFQSQDSVSSSAYFHFRRCKELQGTSLSTTEYGPAAPDGPYTQECHLESGSHTASWPALSGTKPDQHNPGS